jgi:hypothetical protein
MGVDVTVGYLAELKANDAEGMVHVRKRFADITKRLKKDKLPAYKEPEDIHYWAIRVWPQNGIALLQRLAIFLWRKDELPPSPASYGMGAPFEGDDIERIYEDCYFYSEENNAKGQNFRHLVCHSCRDGGWLPVSFDEPFTEGGLQYGSSILLKTQCEAVAEVLKLPLDLDPNEKEVQDALRTPGKSRTIWKRHGIESFNCLLLHKAACLSVERGAAIIIH